MAQKHDVLEILKRKKSGITAGEAIMSLGCLRLAARIKELRDEGHEIITQMRKDIKGKTYARYVLAEG